jgi:hypothetical protein
MLEHLDPAPDYLDPPPRCARKHRRRHLIALVGVLAAIVSVVAIAGLVGVFIAGAVGTWL